MRVIDGHRDMIEADRKRRREARKERLRFIMLECNDPQKVFHAAVRWYALRDKWETPSKSEFGLFSSMIDLLAQEFSPEWIAREFPALKHYKGHKYRCRDYYSSIKALQEAEPFQRDPEKVLAFLMNWQNVPLMRFLGAGWDIMDEISTEDGEPTITEQLAKETGTPLFYVVDVGGGKEIVIDEKGRSLGRMRRPRGKLKVVGKRPRRSLSER